MAILRAIKTRSAHLHKLCLYVRLQNEPKTERRNDGHTQCILFVIAPRHEVRTYTLQAMCAFCEAKAQNLVRSKQSHCSPVVLLRQVIQEQSHCSPVALLRQVIQKKENALAFPCIIFFADFHQLIIFQSDVPVVPCQYILDVLTKFIIFSIGVNQIPIFGILQF